MITVKLDEPAVSREASSSGSVKVDGRIGKAVENRRRGMIFSVIVGSIIVHVIALTCSLLYDSTHVHVKSR